MRDPARSVKQTGASELHRSIASLHVQFDRVPVRYRWIEKWGEVSGRPRHEILALVWRAALEGAPADAIYRDFAGWKTITDIHDPILLAALGLTPDRLTPHS